MHEDFALYALISLIVLGLTALLALFLTVKKSEYSRPAGFVILFIVLISFGLVANTANLGGKIRHTELTDSATTIRQDSIVIEGENVLLKGDSLVLRDDNITIEEEDDDDED